MENKLDIFTNRLKKIGIVVEYMGNFPWVYLSKINGNQVTETYRAEWGFTVAFRSVKYGEESILKFTDLKTIFNLIRKYNGSK